MIYNSQRSKLIIKEYGRHIQQLVDYTKTLTDREERNNYAKTIIELMGMLFPHLKNVEDFRHKLWDHLFIMAEFNLDVDSPYPIPTKEVKEARPAPLKYPKNSIKFRHYGKNVEILIEKAIAETNLEKQTDFAQGIATVMKMTYRSFNREGVTDDTIREDLRMMSDGILNLSNEVDIEQGVKRNINIDNSEGVPPRRKMFNNNRNGNNNNNRNGNNNNNRNNNGNGNNRNGNNNNNNRNNNNNNRNNNNNKPRFNNNRPNGNVQ